MTAEDEKELEYEPVDPTSSQYMEEPAQPEAKTKLEQFMDKLRVYATEPEAKTHIQEIAKTLECAKSLGYKAIKKLRTEGAFGNIPRREAHEPTMKIREVDEGELEQPPQEEQSEIQFQDGETAEAVTVEPSLQPTTGFQPEDIEWMMSRSAKLIADATEYAEFELSKADSKKLSEMWTPIVNQYLPQIMPNMPLVVAGFSTALILVPKVRGYMKQRKKNEKPIIDTQPVEKKTEPPKEQPKPEQQTAPEKLPDGKNILRNLGD